MTPLRALYLRFHFRVLSRIRARVWPWCNEPGCWSRSHRLTNACAFHAWERIQRVVLMSDEEFDRS